MTSVSYHISNLLEKMTSSDKDFRFMATNDLMTELQKDSIKLDDDSERKRDEDDGSILSFLKEISYRSSTNVVKMLLKLLEDKNGEVQNLAVKCLGPLVSKVKDYQVEIIVETLCNNMLSDKEQLRDISSIGLKTVINELPPSSNTLATSICKGITGRLTNAITKQEDVSVKLEALDILGDLLSRFGALLLSFHPTIQAALLPQLSSSRMAVRKRAIIALGHLVLSSNKNLFNDLIEFLLSELSANTNPSTTRTFIQCIASISRQAGHRVGEHMEKIIPLIVKFCEVEEDDELQEYCLQAFESFVRRCPREISPYLHKIIELCLKYLCYDPNYNYDDDEEEEEDAMDTEMDEEGESDDEYSDDDDMSWKVRRASAKCLQAVIASRHDMLPDFYKTVSPALIGRFKEREENVKADIFQAYVALLRQTKPVNVNIYDPDAMEQEEGPVAMLRQQVPDIVRAIHKQMKEKSVKTRQGCLTLLTELIHVSPGALANHIPALVPGIQYSLGDKNGSSNMKIDTLTFLNCLLLNHNPQVFHPHLAILVPPVIAAVGDSFYKTTSEALLVTQTLVKVIRPIGVETSFDFTQFVLDLFECTLTRLKAADIDQEVKERAISCMGQIICNLGDHLASELGTCLPIFLDRLRNEITRLTTVKALMMIAGSPLKIDISPILPQGVPILASFLRKNHRALKLSTLGTLDIIIKNYGTLLTEPMIDGILAEIPPLINESDLHISQLTLNLLTSLCCKHPKSMAKICDNIMQEIFILVRSPLLQGGALNSLLSFFQALVATKTPKMEFRDLLGLLTAPIYNPTETTQPSGSQYAVHKQAFHSIAKCVAVLTISSSGEGASVITQCVNDIKNPKSSDSINLFALLSLGEIGKHVDLSGNKELKNVIIESFSSSSEEVKSAASFALGSVSVGNLTQYLPFVLKEIEMQPKRQYLLLHSLKEIITCQSSSNASVEQLTPFVLNIWTMLFNHCECPEEGTRNVVAECLGKLTLIDSANLLPKLKDSLRTDSSYVKSTVVTAVKFTISDQPQPIDSLLKSCIGDFLETMQDDDINVRRVALITFNSAAHNKPSLIRDLLEKVLPHLYNETKVKGAASITFNCAVHSKSILIRDLMEKVLPHVNDETKVKKELIREVEMGPFKHTVDDGLDIRKAAFECMYTLLDSCLDRLDIFEFLNHVEDGLKDHYDVKMLTYLMLVRLSTLSPNALLQRFDRLIDPLRTTLTTKVRANSVKQEFEKQDELKRSAMRAVNALQSIPDSDKSPQLNDFIGQIRSSPELATIYESVQKDSTSHSSDSLMDTS